MADPDKKKTTPSDLTLNDGAGDAPTTTPKGDATDELVELSPAKRALMESMKAAGGGKRNLTREALAEYHTSKQIEAGKSEAEAIKFGVHRAAQMVRD